ncbi:MAG: hypothetical protein AAFX99_36820, partial [Myxococcota bacterium]
HLEQALDSYRAGLDQARDVAHTYLQSDALQRIWSTKLARADLEGALETAQTLHTLAQQAQVPDLEAQAAYGLGSVALAQGAFDRAVTTLNTALTLATDAHNETLQLQLKLTLADAHLHQGAAPQALLLLEAIAPETLDRQPLLHLEHSALLALCKAALDGHNPIDILHQAQRQLDALALGERSRLARLVARATVAVRKTSNEGLG